MRIARSAVLLWVWAGCVFVTGCTTAKPATPVVSSSAAVRLRAHDSSRWEREIEAYERQDRAAMPPRGGIVFTGSSTIRLWTTLAEDFPNHTVINRGFGGSEIVDAAEFAPRIVLPYQPRMVVLSAGTNDINNGVSAEQVAEDFKAFVAIIHASLPRTKVVFVSLSPRISRWNQREKNKVANELIKAFASKTPNVVYIETYDTTITPDGEPRRELFRPDNLHFNAEGYRVLAERIRPYLD